MMRVGLIRGIVIVGLMVGSLQAGKTTQQVQKLHREIGKNLIQIRNENPTLQTKVFTLLDQVGSMYRLSSSTLEKKRKAKRAFGEQIERVHKLEHENSNLKAEVARLRQQATYESNRFSELAAAKESLAREKNEILNKALEHEAREQEYMARVKELEKKNQKSTSKPSSTRLASGKPEKAGSEHLQSASRQLQA